MKKIVQTLYNPIMDTVAYAMKIGVILSLPVMFVYYLFNHKKVWLEDISSEKTGNQMNLVNMVSACTIPSTVSLSRSRWAFLSILICG